MEKQKTREVAGRTWRAVRTEPYTRLDGTETTLRVWQTHCRKCERLVEVRLTLNADPAKSHAVRDKAHCEEHKRKRGGRPLSKGPNGRPQQVSNDTVLHAMRRAPGASMRELQRALGYASTAAVTYRMHKLEAEGLVTQDAGRKWVVVPQPDGLELLS